MEYNDETNYLGICQDINQHLGFSMTDTSSYPIEDKTRNVNEWYRKANTWIWQATGTWEYDDSNYTDFPIATADLVDAQQDYALPTTAQKIDRVEVLDSEGSYHLIKPLDKGQIKGSSMSEFYKEDGFPAYYDLVGASVFLYPAPAAGDVTTTAGLKLYFTRDISVFTSSSTTTEPGFARPFHRILSLGAALDYAIGRKMWDRVNPIKREIKELKVELQEFYGNRHRDMKARVRPDDSDQI